MVRGSLSASAEGRGPAALFLVVGAILLLLAYFCFRGVEAVRGLGGKTGDGMCVILVLVGIGCIGFAAYLALRQ